MLSESEGLYELWGPPGARPLQLSPVLPFLFEIHQVIEANSRALRQKFDPIPWGLLDEDRDGAPEPDGRFIKRILGREQWIHVHRQAIMQTYDWIMTELFPRYQFEERYLRRVADFCFARSSLTLKQPRALSL